MNIDMTSETLLVQLGYTASKTMVEQMNNIIQNTKKFNNFSKHILSLNDELQHLGAFVALSNSHQYLKIKIDDSQSDVLTKFENIINKWANKYKVKLEKVKGRNTYYIIGQE